MLRERSSQPSLYVLAYTFIEPRVSQMVQRLVFSLSSLFYFFSPLVGGLPEQGNAVINLISIKIHSYTIVLFLLFEMKYVSLKVLIFLSVLL